MYFHVLGITCHHVARRGLNEQRNHVTPRAALIDIETIKTQLSSELSQFLPSNLHAALLAKSQRTDTIIRYEAGTSQEGWVIQGPGASTEMAKPLGCLLRGANLYPTVHDPSQLSFRRSSPLCGQLITKKHFKTPWKRVPCTAMSVRITQPHLMGVPAQLHVPAVPSCLSTWASRTTTPR